MNESDKKTFIAWVKAHRKQLIIAGISVAAIVLAILAVKNKGAIMKIWIELKDSISDIANSVDKIPTERRIPTEENTRTVIAEVIEAPKQMDAGKTSHYKCPFEVCEHIRTLSPGCHPTQEKLVAAREKGILLMPNQTWVKQYTKGLEAA